MGACLRTSDVTGKHISILLIDCDRTAAKCAHAHRGNRNRRPAVASANKLALVCVRACCRQRADMLASPKCGASSLNLSLFCSVPCAGAPSAQTPRRQIGISQLTTHNSQIRGSPRALALAHLTAGNIRHILAAGDDDDRPMRERVPCWLLAAPELFLCACALLLGGFLSFSFSSRRNLARKTRCMRGSSAGSSDVFGRIGSTPDAPVNQSDEEGGGETPRVKSDRPRRDSDFVLLRFGEGGFRAKKRANCPI